jgi:3-oxoacyl-[acyl-carrier protein] reductase
VIPVESATDDDWQYVMTTNALGTFRSLRECAHRMGDGGRVINISSLNTVLPSAGIGLYAASKAAIEQLSAVAAIEFGPRQITANSVSPGATDTDMLRGANSAEDVAAMAAMSPLCRLGQPSDVADVVAFLAREDGRWIAGQNIQAAGGLR